MSMDEFRNELKRRFAVAERQGHRHLDVTSGELHDALGQQNRMPMACNAMWQEHKRGGATVLSTVPSGQSTTIKIRYELPRPVDA
jgi:hypothetical protein